MKDKKLKVCLVGSSGGHLTHLYMLKPFWKDKNRFWVTFDKEDLQKKNSQNWKRQRKCQSRLMRIALKPHLSGRLNLEELIRRVTEWMPMGHNHNQEKYI